MRIRSIAVTAVLLVTVSACSSPPPTTEEPEQQSTVPTVVQPTTPSPSAPSADIKRYFELLGKDEPDSETKAAKLAAPNSVAFAYATHQAARSTAYFDTGQAAGDQEVADVSQTEKGYSLCYEGDDCFVYADLKTRSGKLSAFTINGKDITKRLSLGNGAKVRAGNLATVQLISSYLTVGNSLIVNLKVRAKKDVDLNQFYGAQYRERSGRTVKASDAFVLDDLDADSTLQTSLTFNRVKPGGTITVDVINRDTYDSETVKVHV